MPKRRRKVGHTQIEAEVVAHADDKKPNSASGCLTPTLFLSFLALLVSALSLATSIRSYLIAREGQEMRRREYEYARRVVLLGTVSHTKNVTDMLKLAPSDPSLALHELEMILPPGFRDTRSDLSPDFTIRGFQLRPNLTEAEHKLAPIQIATPGYFEVEVPLVLDAKYTLKGEPLHAAGVYKARLTADLRAEAINSEYIYEFRFERHLGIGEDASRVLKSLWKEPKIVWQASP